MPKSIHVHKSMLIRGVHMPKPVLERADIEATKAKASGSGRSFGGAPFRGDRNSGGRGGRINYADNTANPFAKHLDPNFVPPPNLARGPPQHSGYANGHNAPPPRNNGYQNGPAPSYNGAHHIPPPHANYGRGSGPPQGYRGGYGSNYNVPPPQGYQQSGGYYGASQGGAYHGRQ